MLAISGVLLLFVSWGVFQWTLGRGSYRRYPHEQFVLVRAGGDASTVSSVASFFVSRVDTAVDGLLENGGRERSTTF